MKKMKIVSPCLTGIRGKSACGNLQSRKNMIYRGSSIREVCLPFRLRNGPRIVFLAFHGICPKKESPGKGAFRGFITTSKFLLQAQQSVCFVLAGRKYALRGYSQPYWLAVGVSFLHIAVVECFLK